MNTSILIVDDNQQFRTSLTHILTGSDYKVDSVGSGRDVIAFLEKNRVDVILLDVRLGDESGVDVLMYCKERYPLIPIIMLTGFATIESAVNSIKIGAYDYIQKPVKFEKLTAIIENATTMASLKNENQNLYGRLEDLSPRIISKDSRIHGLLATIDKLSGSSLAILLSGENGIGKELFADYIHSRSNRRAFPLVKVNCAAFPEGLLDNELFGHEKGAYTGADSTYKGVFEKADKGTLFLDEIGDMSLGVQSKVLRVLQNKELYRLGGNKLIAVDIHFISATNQRLETLIEQGKFREDLYYRLNAATINIPPLRERKEDISLLIDHFLDIHARESGKPKLQLDDSALSVLQQHNWPGNIRELKNVVNYSAAVCHTGNISIEDLPGQFSKSNVEVRGVNLLQDTEKMMILNELKKQNNNKKKVAEALNISRSTLYSKMRKHDI